MTVPWYDSPVPLWSGLQSQYPLGYGDNVMDTDLVDRKDDAFDGKIALAFGG